MHENPNLEEVRIREEVRRELVRQLAEQDELARSQDRRYLALALSAMIALCFLCVFASASAAVAYRVFLFIVEWRR